MNDQISAGHAKILIGLSNEDQLKISNSIIGQQLSVRATENMIKDLKKDIDNKKIKNSNKTGKLNFESLNTILKTFKSRGLKVKLNNDTLNIHFQSQEDINNITKLFS